MVTKKFATKKSVHDGSIAPMTPVVTKKSSSPSRENYFLSPLEIFRKQDQQRKQQKEKKQQKINQQANKEQEELLQLLKQSYITPPTVKSIGETTKTNVFQNLNQYGTESSGTSDQSDIESTPVPFTSSYKTTTKRNDAEFLMNQVGKKHFDILSKTLGMEEEQVSESSEKSPCQKTFGATFKPFDSNDVPNKDPNILAHRLDVDYLLYAVSGGKSAKKKHQASNQNDSVLIYGKRKGEPIKSLDQMSLPDPLGVNLKALGCKTLSPFQSHMWPSLAALRNVVGIAEGTNTDTSAIIAYVLPIIRNVILDDVTYREIGSGNGVSCYICRGLC